MTNQHVVSTCLATLSSGAHDYLQDGFYAASPGDEARCPGLDVKVVTVEDVTQQVPVPQKRAATGQAAQREATITRLESECAARNGEACEIVSLFSGSRYELYRYKRYTDVRLVFAPEQLAFFGRERDSITYLRYGLDIAFARA